jgi:hypothetical protein
MAKRSAAARACRFIQLYARLMETDENGYGYCCSCGKSLSWGETQGGHFHPKGHSYNAAAFEEENVHVQCASCNLYHKGNPSGYAKYMDKEYGEINFTTGKFENLVVDHINSLIHTYLETEEVKAIAKIYRQKCVDLAKDKNFPVNLK